MIFLEAESNLVAATPEAHNATPFSSLDALAFIFQFCEANLALCLVLVFLLLGSGSEIWRMCSG